MRLTLATALLVWGAVGCGTTSTEDHVDAPRPAGPSTRTESPATGSKSPAVISRTTTTVPPGSNQALTRRARAVLIRAGAEQLVETPGYEGEVNTAFTGVWRERPFMSYTVPTTDSVDGELMLVSTFVVAGHDVEVMQVADGAVRLLRFTRGPDTWLLSALTPDLGASDMSRSRALVAKLVR